MPDDVAPALNRAHACSGRTATSLIAVVAMCLTPTRAAGGVDDKPKTEQRCGWLVNPTPGNWEFVDRDGNWQIASQGEEGAIAGLPEDRPTGRRWWVETNSGGYGYGCMCLTAEVDRIAMRFVRITAGKSLTLKTCRKARTINKLEPTKSRR